MAAPVRGRRGGATLTEVLMSILVMGIGVISLATLFPIAILRTAQANKLTNATIVFHNARALIETYPHLVHDPNNNANYYLPETSTQFNLNGVIEHHDEDTNGNGTFEQAQEDFNGNGRFDRGVYIVDPLGWHEYQALGLTYPNSTVQFQQRFGNNGFDASGDLNPLPDPPVPWIPRFNGGTSGMLQTVTGPVRFIQNRRDAARWLVLPDSWQEVVTAGVTGQTSTSVDLNVASGLLSDVDPATARYRLTLFESSATSRRPGSVVREMWQAPAGTTVSWNESAGGDENGNGINGEEFALPAGFEVERARLEVQDWRFSWLLTVRKGPWPGGAASVDVVVFFRRSFREDDETIHASHFVRGTPANGLTGWDGAPGVAGVDDNFDGQIDDDDEIGWPGSDDNRTAYVFWNSGGTEPRLKRGAFVFEAVGGHWYRIVDFRVETAFAAPPAAPNGEDTRATLLLDRDIAVDVPAVATTAATGPGGAIVMPNVVEVFPLSEFSAPPLTSQTRVR